MPAQLLHVKIFTPLKLLFEGEAFAVSSVNSSGPFDILPQHANFITLVEGHPLELRNETHLIQIFHFSQAIVYSKDNLVVVYAEPLHTEGI